jgi:DNA repair protein RecO (recombination protein O)
MTQEIKDEAVCVRRQNYSESSQIVTLFSRAHGKIRAMAKGSRRSRGRFGGGLDLLSIGTILFLPPRGDSGLATLVEFELEHDDAELRRRLIPLHCAEYAASLLADFTEEMDPHETLYTALIDSLKAWRGGESPEKALIRFELTLFTEIGLGPVWDACSRCKGSLSTSPRVSFHTRQGGMLCGRCSSAMGQTHPVSFEALKVLANPANSEAADREVWIEAHELLTWYATEILGRKSPIMRFLSQLLRKKG